MPSIPHTSPPHYPDHLSPARFAFHIHQTMVTACRVALLGLPDDFGVRLNHGRPGAAAGPRAFRDALSRYGVAEPEGWTWPKIFDAGDIIPAPGHDEAALHETHRRVTDATAAILELGLFPIAIGGGHDLTFPFVRAVINKFGPMPGVYYDAHLDVRETPGSGMPFRKLIEDCRVPRLINLGVDPLANSRAHVDWFNAHGGEVAGGLVPPLKALAGGCFASFDLDVIDMSAAPGVSAARPAGWSAAMASEAAHEAGRTLPLKCFDIMELSPAHDEGGRTARLAAHLFLSFLRGFSGRAH